MAVTRWQGAKCGEIRLEWRGTWNELTDLSPVMATFRGHRHTHHRRLPRLRPDHIREVGRRSGLVELQCGDVTLDGEHVRLRRPKIDENRAGTVRALPFTARHQHCPTCAWHPWAQFVAAFDTDRRVEVIRWHCQVVEIA